jgi:hypothetical protein
VDALPEDKVDGEQYATNKSEGPLREWLLLSLNPKNFPRLTYDRHLPVE